MSLTKVSYSMITGAPVNVLDYGADPTGATDSTVAIQAALDSGGAVIFFPYGTYKIAGGASPSATTLIVPSTVYELRGEGGFRTPTQLNFTGTNYAGTAFDIQSTNIRSVSNLYLNTGTGNGNFTNIIKVADNTHFAKWENVSTNGGATTHWVFGNNTWCQCLINCGAWGTDWTMQAGIKIGNNGNAFDFYSCHFNHCGIGVWLIDYLESFNYFGGEIASNVRYGAYIGSDSGLTGGLENVNFYGVYFEDQPTHIIQNSINMKGLYVTNCRTSETSWTNFILLNNITYSVQVNGGTFLRYNDGNSGTLVNVNNQAVVDCFVEAPFQYNVTTYKNQGNQQVWYRTNRIGGSPGQISYETKGIQAQEDYYTPGSYAGKILKQYLANGTSRAYQEKGFSVVWDATYPGGGGSLYSGFVFQRGDVCWNTSAASGGAPGWVCVSAGTPGTWKAMANLA